MRTHTPRLLGAAAVLLTASSLGAPAFADDIANDLDGTIDATAEVLAVNAGDTGTTTLRVVPTSNDGKSGCNLTGSNTVTFAVASSNTGAATVSPASVTFGSCSDTRTLTVTGVAEGSSDITLRQTAATTTSTYDAAPAAFRVNVARPAPANTAPKVEVTGVEAASYELGQAMPTPGCLATDAEDGTSRPEPVVTRNVDAAGLGAVDVSCSYTDAGGLTATSSVTYALVDTIAPQIAIQRTPAPAANGWNTGEVTVSWTCTDGGSGPVAADGSTVVGEGRDQSVTGTCADRAGNTSEATVDGINVDTTAPGVLWGGGPAADGSYYYGSVPAAGTCTATDALSGPDGCAVTGYGAAVGSHELTATAQDVAGNTSVEKRGYTVKAWTHRGFYQPVDMGGVLNTVQNGSTVPLKFELFAGDTELTSTSAVKGFSATAVSCTTQAATEDAIEVTTTGGTSLRYDATAGQFVQNWQTPKKPGACYQVTMTTQDGSSTSALFKLR